jgi:hypothetical protein
MIGMSMARLVNALRAPRRLLSGSHDDVRPGQPR